MSIYTDNATVFELLNKDERRKLKSRNNTNADYNKDAVIHELFEATVATRADEIALIFQNQRISYDYLNKRASQLAYALKDNGVQRGDFVSVIVNRSVEMIIAILAVLKAGAAYLPIDPKYPRSRIEHMLSDCNVKLLLSSREIVSNLNLKYDYLDLFNPDIYTQSDSDIVNMNTSSDLAYLIYTSGSTGNPKGVMITHKSLNNFILGMNRVIPFNSEKRILNITTISFDTFQLETILALINGMTVIIANEEQQKNPRLLCNLIVEHNIDMFQATPSQLRLILNDKSAYHGLNLLTDIMVGGEAFPKDLLEKLQQITKANIYNMYGPTETTIWSTVGELTESNDIHIGSPIVNTQIYIMDEYGHVLPEETVGELCIAGDGVARGYVNNQVETDKRFVSLPSISEGKVYRTGDLAKWRSNGAIEHCGRVDDQVKVRGHRIELGEIEYYLRQYKNCRDAAVTLRDNSFGEEVLCAYLELSEDISAEDISKFLSAVLPEYMIPASYSKVEHLPLTPNYKVDKKALPNPFGVNDFGNIAVEVICDKACIGEEQIVNVLAKIIGTSELKNQSGYDFSLPVLGIDSLTFITIIAELETAFDIIFEDSYLDINQFPTLKSLIIYTNALLLDKKNN